MRPPRLARRLAFTLFCSYNTITSYRAGGYAMKLSQISMDQLSSLTAEQIDRIVFDEREETLEKGLAAILLGGSPSAMKERVKAAAELYARNVVPYIIPTGGVRRETDRGFVSEAEYMALMLMEAGVPENAIILENEATTTRENMLYVSLVLEKRFHPRGSYRLYIVSSPSHIKRSLAFASLYLPRTAMLSAYSDSTSPGNSGVWMQDELQRSRVQTEVIELKKTVDCGEMEDIEF